MSEEIKQDIILQLRENSRANLTKFSKQKKYLTNKVHYEYKKIKKDIKKFTQLINFEKLGLKRTIILFHNATEGLTTTAKQNKFSINNLIRLDQGLIAEYIFIDEKEQQKLIKTLNNKKIKFNQYLVEKVIKQETFKPKQQNRQQKVL